MPVEYDMQPEAAPQRCRELIVMLIVAASTDASSFGVSERTTAAPGPGEEAILIMVAVGWSWASPRCIRAVGRPLPRRSLSIRLSF